MSIKNELKGLFIILVAYPVIGYQWLRSKVTGRPW
jgi:hypothetical protein